MRFRVGFLVNPLAGIGGTVALKGSDGKATVNEALRRGARPRAAERASLALAAIASPGRHVYWLTWAGGMGEQVLDGLGFECQVLGGPEGAVSDASDTRRAVRSFIAAGVDLLVFAGGDGTARDVYDALAPNPQLAIPCSSFTQEDPSTVAMPVLGIPAGVKMHSAVFAVSAQAAGTVLASMASGELVQLRRAEVRDIDEQALRQGRIRSSYYGELWVPEAARYMQHLKHSGREVESLVVDEIADYVVEHMVPEVLYLLGPGTTTRAVMERLGLPCTLLGVDLVKAGRCLRQDVDEQQLLAMLRASDSPAELIITPTGGQGSLLGRGNQQLSAAVLREIGLENVLIVSAKSKLAELNGRPLLVDTGDTALDRQLSGLRQVVTGYQDQVLYPVATELTAGG